MTETELCDIVKKSDLFPGFRLHEEVGISSVSCDMVYENGNEVYTIEAKTELNFKVIAQAIRWQRVVTASFIAVPVSSAKWWWDNPKRAVVEALGLGIIWVGKDKASFAFGCNPFVNPLRERCDLYKFPADMDYWRSAFSGVDGRHVDALLSRMHAERLPKPRLYVFSPRWLDPLKELLALSSGGVREAYIQDFATIGTNTFARAAHFGIVAKGGKPGWWRLTERGYAFLAGRSSIPAAMSYSGGASKVWLHGPTPRGRYGGKAFIDIHDVERELREG